MWANRDGTDYLVMFRDNRDDDIESYSFQQVNDFKYKSVLIQINSMHNEIKSRISVRKTNIVKMNYIVLKPMISLLKNWFFANDFFCELIFYFYLNWLKRSTYFNELSITRADKHG